MAIIGFLFLLAIGGYFLFAGITYFVAEMGLTGRTSAVPFVLLCIAVGVLFIAFKYAPFTISFASS